MDLTFTHSFFQTTTQKKDVTIATFQDAYHLAIAQTNLANTATDATNVIRAMENTIRAIEKGQDTNE